MFKLTMITKEGETISYKTPIPDIPVEGDVISISDGREFTIFETKYNFSGDGRFAYITLILKQIN